MTVTDHEIPIAVRDSGTDGQPVLLLHGLGGTLDAWAQLDLGGCRTVAMDLRGHGLSGDGPWEWDRGLDDVEAVVRSLGLGNPAVVGHSLGGMLAVQWALRHPECPAVVDLDGLRSAESDPQNYPGMDPATRDQELASLKASFDAQAMAMDQPLPPEMRALFPQRALVERDGRTYGRPAARLLEEVRYTPEFRDTVRLLRRVVCPALVVIPTHDPPGTPGGELMEAFRRGIRRDLAGLPAHVQVRELEASHGMLAERPRALSDLIGGFLRQAG
ncbi:alpha/beta fold hydrolase [Promicromonospora iranensis]|uniref:Pimeloyl-ACP methyl ester carboxylesterase n=1 Tax=Promicromonospora iranensis TaxID=1105144 RepID=A0ABU2CHE0_9MICO|nr:alpha/beta hydrolase [Promicromonospora iranensis]MDR7380734.1 pimeloyl-ACP methyl ester carboxylesterase [Promicromonospora iranensis]